MFEKLLIIIFAISISSTKANTIIAANATEIVRANTNVQPGDTIILRNGEWKNVHLELYCSGSIYKPIIFKAETKGKVIITGNSNLKISGKFIIVDGLYFTNGYSGSEGTITFRNNKNEGANNCRLTNTVINNFNNPKRLNENHWVILYGKNNRIDHCTFVDKKNLGVLLAVKLDDERSTENFHSIDHNYFGVRLPLASNGGEIIRIGVSEQCEYNSNTQITDNFFEHCDGETEIISIKSCRNTVKNNLFKECQGAVVLRHGNFNTVTNNVFLGNNKPGSGGVRIINRGQWVVNNLFYKCRGEGFRAPLSIMNGVPNSPANRYVPVTDAVVANNSFFECSPISFCEGSDTERSVVPSHVLFANNLFFNIKDSIIYNTYDDISGIKFIGNLVTKALKKQLTKGFEKTALFTSKAGGILFPATQYNYRINFSDSIQKVSQERLVKPLALTPGFSNAQNFIKIKANAYSACGAKWFNQKYSSETKKIIIADCKNGDELTHFMANNPNKNLIANLTGQQYILTSSLNIQGNVQIISKQNKQIIFKTSPGDFCFQLIAGNTLTLDHISLDLSETKNKIFITTDTSGSSNHSSFVITNCNLINMSGIFFKSAKSSISDSIVIRNCSFFNGQGILFKLDQEVDKKGYYNVENLKMSNNTIKNYIGQILSLLRSGKDESTMGPTVWLRNNSFTSSNTVNNAEGLIVVNGIQKTLIEGNHFNNCNEGYTLITYKDEVRADHVFRKNTLIKSGKISTDKYVLISD